MRLLQLPFQSMYTIAVWKRADVVCPHGLSGQTKNWPVVWKTKIFSSKHKLIPQISHKYNSDFEVTALDWRFSILWCTCDIMTKKIYFAIYSRNKEMLLQQQKMRQLWIEFRRFINGHIFRVWN